MPRGFQNETASERPLSRVHTHTHTSDIVPVSPHPNAPLAVTAWVTVASHDTGCYLQSVDGGSQGCGAATVFAWALALTTKTSPSSSANAPTSGSGAPAAADAGTPPTPISTTTPSRTTCTMSLR